MKISLFLRLVGSFIIIALITAFVGLIGFNGIRKAAGRVETLSNDAIPTIIELEIMKVKQTEIKVSMRSLMTPYGTDDDYKRHFENIERIREEFANAVRAYEALDAYGDELRLYRIFQNDLNKARALNDAFIESARGMLVPENRESLSRYLTERGLSGEVRIAFDTMVESLDNVLTFAKEYYGNSLLVESRREVTNNIFIIFISTILGFILALTLGIFIAINISKPVSKISSELLNSSGSLESAAGQVSASSQELSSGASELASSVEEMTSSLEELQSIIESNTKNVGESEIMMRETMKGSEIAVSQMNLLKESHEEIRENSKKIGKIIKVIDDIAFQTNILALNAAVEAARAGEAGRGFAVVADQVKNLAQKSADAAKETSALIETSIDGVNKGYSLGETVSEALSNAVDLAGKVSVILDEVNKASKEQLKGATQVTKAVSQINTVVQQTASSSEETAAAGEELLSQAEVTKNIASQLKTIVTGKNENTGTPYQQNNIKIIRKPNLIENKSPDSHAEKTIPFDDF